MIAVENVLGLMAVDIGNYFCTAPCEETIWSICGQEFGAKFGAIAVIKCALYGLKTAYNSFHDLFGDFLIDMGFTPYRSDQYLWLSKSE